MSFLIIVEFFTSEIKLSLTYLTYLLTIHCSKRVIKAINLPNEKFSPKV